MTDLADLTRALIHAARKAGADSADAIGVEGVSVSVDIRNGALEQAERSEGIEIGLRVLVGRRQACVSASDTRPETIAEMSERAVIMPATVQNTLPPPTTPIGPPTGRGWLRRRRHV
jgi:PmbA protein